MDNFTDKLDNLLTDLANRNLDSYIFNDSNINLHNIETDQHVASYMNCLTNSGFIITNFRTTRIHNGSHSLIDHIITNTKLNRITSGTITEDISDHFITFLQPNLKKTKTKPTHLKRRLYTKSNIDNFRTDLQQLSWNTVTATNTVDDCYDKFWDIYSTLHDLHFPLTTVKFNKNFHKISEFMTPGLLTSRRTKLTLHQTAITSNTPHNWNTYRNYRNLFNKLIRISKNFTMRINCLTVQRTQKRHGTYLEN